MTGQTPIFREIIVDTRGSGIPNSEVDRAFRRVGGIPQVNKLDTLYIIREDGTMLFRSYPKR